MVGGWRQRALAHKICSKETQHAIFHVSQTLFRLISNSFQALPDGEQRPYMAFERYPPAPLLVRGQRTPRHHLSSRFQCVMYPMYSHLSLEIPVSFSGSLESVSGILELLPGFGFGARGRVQKSRNQRNGVFWVLP